MKSFEKSLFALIIALFFVPLLGALPAAKETLASYWASHWEKTDSFWKNTGDFFRWCQRERQGWAATLDRGFLGRDFLIKWTGEAWLHIFHQCATRSSHITIGKTGSLFEDTYLQEYCLLRSTPAALEPVVMDIKRLQSACERLGIGFVMVVAPSKAAIYPEEVPSVWMRRYDPSPRAYDVMAPLLKKHGIHYVDGHMLAQQIKDQAPVPVFPKGGIHWTSYAAWVTSNAIITRLQEQGMPLQRLERGDASYGNDPEGDDMDLLRMMHLARPWHYPVMRFNIKRSPVPPVTATFVGDSFTVNLMRQFANSGQFSEIDLFYYYKAVKACLPRSFKDDFYSDLDNSLAAVSKPVKSINFKREIFGSDCLILEVNEALMNDMPHLKMFLADANKDISTASREPFQYESALPYGWGETISFRAQDAGRLHSGYLDGYSAAEKVGTWTDGKKATLRLHPPAPSGDILLEAELEPMVDPKSFSEQRVKVCVNDKQIGEWRVPPGIRHYKARIPKEYVAREEILALQFNISNPTSPSNLGTSTDKRRLGISVASVRLSNEGGTDSDQNFLPCQWGREIAFDADSITASGYSFLSGFAVPENNHTWTDGSQAMVKLSVPRTHYDLLLTARVGAFVRPGKQQEVKIYANGQPAGTWRFESPAETTRNLLIPQRCLQNGGRLVLRFEISDPVCPANFGSGSDIRNLGICFWRLNLATSSQLGASLPEKAQDTRCSSSDLTAPAP